MPVGEAIGRSKSEKLDLYLKVLYELLRDILLLHEGTGEIRNQDIRRELEALAAKVQFAWIRKAVTHVDEIAMLVRRNIQKTIALDALILDLRAWRESPRSAPLPRNSRQRVPELGEAHRRRFRAFDHALAIRAQRRHGERHGDAVIAEGVERPPRGTSAGPGITMPSGSSSASTPMRRRFSTTVRMRSVSFTRSSAASRTVEPFFGGRAQHGQHRNLVDQRRRQRALDRAAPQVRVLHHDVADQFPVRGFRAWECGSWRPCRSGRSSSAERVGFRPTPRMASCDPGTSSAATMKNAAEERSLGTTSSRPVEMRDARRA